MKQDAYTRLLKKPHCDFFFKMKPSGIADEDGLVNWDKLGTCVENVRWSNWSILMKSSKKRVMVKFIVKCI